MADNNNSDKTRARAAEIAEGLKALEGPLLPILHAVEAEFGFIPRDTLPVIADVLNLSRAEVHGTMSFYPDFHADERGRNLVKLCRAEACQARGGRRLEDHVQASLGITWHETTADRRITLEPVFCLGLCSHGPAALVNGEVRARLDADAFDAMAGGLK